MKLRKQVLAAFKAADASGKIINETGEQTNVKKGHRCFAQIAEKNLKLMMNFVVNAVRHRMALRDSKKGIYIYCIQVE